MLIKQFPFPTIGDFAFIGEDLEHAINYVCGENGQWKRTVTPAIQFADKYKAIYSKDVEDFSAAPEDSYANRANCDALGRVIHNTYVTISELQSIIAEEVKKQLSTQ